MAEMRTLDGTAAGAPAARDRELLAVEGLSVGIGGLTIVDDVTFSVAAGETVGVVGESGSGKTLCGLAIAGLLPAPVRQLAGQVRLEGRDLSGLSERQLRDVRGAGIGMIFQDPIRSLNPAFSVGEQIAEAVRWHEKASRRAAWERAVEMLADVGIRSARVRAHDYPHMFSGGMCQRVMIAVALACRPKLLIADEPTTALDVTIQAQILELLSELQARHSLAILLISHDMGVVLDVSDRVMVMYAGQLVEVAPVRELIGARQHPYTDALLGFATGARGQDQRLETLPGGVPSPGEWPAGCRFAPRCPYAIEHCHAAPPALEQAADRHRVRCHRRSELTLSERES